MEINMRPGLDPLSRALSEAMTIETCSICLQKLKETVLLWPCAHWFCHGCITKVYLDKKGKKIMCPLCNGTTSRRSILPFEDKQKEYEDLLQTLIGAISLDLGFDVTSYKINSNNEVFDNTISKLQNVAKDVCPQKSEMKRLTEAKGKKKTLINNSKRVTRSKKLKQTNALEITHSSTPCKPPETPNNYKEKKVQDWLSTTRFSIGDPLTENTLDNSNKIDEEDPSFSENMLKSVSQIESNIKQSPSNLNGKGKQQKCMQSQFTKSTNSSSEQFDKLLLQENKSRFIKTTYGNNSRPKSRKCVAINSDIFNITGDSKNQNKTMDIDETSDKSESPLKDFSSGSGEEWCFSKKKRISIKKRSKIHLKSEKNTIASSINQKVSNMKGKSYPVSKGLKNQDVRKSLTIKDASNRSLLNKNNSSVEKNESFVNKKSEYELKPRIGETVKEIICDWDNFSEINCKDNYSKQVIDESNQVSNETPSKDDAVKHSNLSSPGWSRLTRTKKEFNVSEKKKLSLNKSNTSEKTSLSNNHETSKQCSNVVDETACLNKEQDFSIEKIPPSKVVLDVNQSLSTAECTSFRGFNVPVPTKKRDRDSGICNDSRLSSPERKKICRDVEVQTSPSHMQACIKEYLKKALGEDVGELLSNELKNTPFSETPNLSRLKTILDPKANIQQTQNDNIIHQNICSQDSDKENVAIPINNSIHSDRFIDSDFILGTEDTKTVDGNQQYLFNLPSPEVSASPNIVDDMIVENVDEIDPDAVTQPYYKTPVVPNRILKTSTRQLCSAVSNPTDSELKKVNDIFLNNDTIYPELTPVSTNTFNDSGIVQLEKSSVKVNTVEDRKCRISKSQELREKGNRSRRQLDFVEESSHNDMDMFEASPPESSSHPIEQRNNLTEKDNRETTQEQVCPNKIIENHHKTETCSVNHGPLNDMVGNNNFEAFNKEIFPETSEDYFVEGTPDTSQRSLHQEEDIAKADDIDFVSTCKESMRTHSDKNGTNGDVGMSHQVPEQEQRLIGNIKSPNTIECNKSLQSPISSPKNHMEELQNNRSEGNKKIIMESNYVKQPEENSEMTENTEVTEPVNYCFASSLLTGDQNLLLMTVLKGLDIPYSRTVGEHISHLIVSTSNGCTKNTYKVLYAMALHKPIIRFEWVEHVLKTGGTTVSLDPFIALDPSGECGVLRARKDKKRELLHEFAIHVYNVIESVIKKEQIEELVRLCGGTVVSKLNQFQGVPRHMHRIIILSEPPDTCTQGEWRQKYCAAEVSVDWLYNTIGRYKVLPVAAYMIEQTDAVQFLLHEGYPEDLIFDMSLQNDSISVL